MGSWHHLMLFFNKMKMKKSTKTRRIHDKLLLLAAMLARWWRPVAFSEALDLLHWAMHAVLYRRTTNTIKMASKVGAWFHCCFVCCCPGSCWGNMEWAVTQWRCPVASGIALDMLHRVMHLVLHRWNRNGRQTRYIWLSSTILPSS